MVIALFELLTISTSFHSGVSLFLLKKALASTKLRQRVLAFFHDDTARIINAPKSSYIIKPTPRRHTEATDRPTVNKAQTQQPPLQRAS